MIFRPGSTQLLVPSPGVHVVKPHGLSALYNSLVGFWKLDEASGDAPDSVGANTLTDTNTVTNATGLVYATARSFASASSEYLTIADNAALSTGDIDFWMAAWVYIPVALSDATNHCFIAKDSTGTTREYRLWSSGWTPNFLVMNNGVSSGQAARASSFTGTGWQLLVGVHDAGNNLVKFYFNAEAVVSSSYSGGSANSTAPFRIGQLQETSEYWNGRIGPAMIGKGYVPTAGDIAFLYNAGVGRTLEAMKDY